MLSRRRPAATAERPADLREQCRVGHPQTGWPHASWAHGQPVHAEPPTRRPDWASRTAFSLRRVGRDAAQRHRTGALRRNRAVYACALRPWPSPARTVPSPSCHVPTGRSRLLQSEEGVLARTPPRLRWTAEVVSRVKLSARARAWGTPATLRFAREAQGDSAARRKMPAPGRLGEENPARVQSYRRAGPISVAAVVARTVR
jgi:hypothetical protein